MIENDLLAFALSVAVVSASCWVFRAKLPEFSLGATVLLTPLSHVDFMPQQLFGIPGVNPVNLYWFVAFFSLLRTAAFDDWLRSIRGFFSAPLSVFLALYLIAVLRTVLDAESLRGVHPEHLLSGKTILIQDGIKPPHYVLTGFLVALYGISHRTVRPIAKALLLLPIVLAPLVAYLYSIGVELPPEAMRPSYYAGRVSISEHMGYHANPLGRLALYLLLFALVAENLPWNRLRALAIFGAVTVIALSFSRTVYIASFLLVPLALWRASARDRIVTLASALVVAVALYPQLLERIQFGVDSAGRRAGDVYAGDADLELGETGLNAEVINDVSAGRIGRIWPMVFPNFLEHPIVGQGILSIFKPVDPEKLMNYTHPHNAYLEVAIDMGIVGLLALGWMLWWMGWRIGRAYPPFLFLLAAWMLGSIMGDSFYPRLFNSLNWIVLGMGVAVYTAERDPLALRGSISGRG